VRSFTSVLGNDTGIVHLLRACQLGGVSPLIALDLLIFCYVSGKKNAALFNLLDKAFLQAFHQYALIGSNLSISHDQEDV